MKTIVPKGQSPDYHFNAYFSKTHPAHLFHKRKIDNISNFIEPGKTVLDAGCGTSALCFLLARKNCKVHGIDIKKSYIEFISKKCGGKFYHGDLRKINLKKKFDVVTCLDVIEHFNHEDRKKVLKNLDRHTKQGGILILAFPSKIYLTYVEKPWHFIRNKIYGKHDYDDFGTHEKVSENIIEKFFKDLDYTTIKKSSLGYGLDRCMVFKK